jgi:hypothetical protein
MENPKLWRSSVAILGHSLSLGIQYAYEQSQGVDLKERLLNWLCQSYAY